MQPRRLRPVAALTLALLAAPFLAATAVATQSGSATRPVVERRAVFTKSTWLSATNASVQRALEMVGSTAAPPPPPPAPPPAIDDKAAWIWPADGPITSSFGRRWGRMHAGVDIDAAYGGAVIAAQRGVVVAAGWGESGYGQVVKIDHGAGVVTLYAHLSSISAIVGQRVVQGERIGAVGNTGSVTAAHLHYEVRLGGAARNPLLWLSSSNHSTRGNPG